MKQKLLDRLVCPKDHGELQCEAKEEDHGRIIEGALSCQLCSSIYPIIKGIPRFVTEEHYAENFGFQWNQYQKTQLDSYSKVPISKDRYRQVCDWEQKNGGWTLEVGCGAGRFTEIASEDDVEILSVDASIAVEANYRNNGDKDNVHIIQADLRELPFLPHSFERVYCLGVLQHTPDPKQSFGFLLKMVTQGGELAFDVYSKTWDTILWSKYWLRPITKRIDHQKLFKLIQFWTPLFLRVHDILRFIPYFGRYMAHRFVPVCNYKYSFPFTKEQNIEWAVLDTFDMLAPAHDYPCSLDTVNGWLENLELSKKDTSFGPNGIIGKIILK